MLLTGAAGVVEKKVRLFSRSQKQVLPGCPLGSVKNIAPWELTLKDLL